MAYYPSPRNDDEIFNPSNFPSSNPLSNLGQFALLYPTAQGPITFTDTVAGVLNVLEIGAGGIEYNGVNVSFEKIAAIQALSQATNSTTLNINNALTIQNGETSLPPTTSMTLGSASGNLTMLLNDGGVSSYGTAGQVLTSGGSGGSLTWTSVAGGGDDLNDVLGYGNTTTLTAIFNSFSVGSPTTTISNGGLGISVGQAINTVSNSGMAVISGIEQTSYEADGMEYIVTVAGLTTDKTIIDDVIALQAFTAGTLTSTVGIQKNGAGLQLNTNGTLTLNGLGGSNGQVLSYSGGNAVWATSSGGTTIQKGETAVASMNSTSGTVTYASTFATKPYVVVSFNNNGVTTFIPIGVLSHQQNAGLQYTGFTWTSASTSATATITWYATI